MYVHLHKTADELINTTFPEKLFKEASRKYN